MTIFIAKQDFINSTVNEVRRKGKVIQVNGNVKSGDEILNISKAEDLCTYGYVREYKTKVVQQKPVKPRKKRAKKVAKK